MSVKTERITLLATPDFKAFLNTEASREGISVSELIRVRCTNKPVNNKDEQLLRALVDQVNDSTKKAQKSLAKGLQDAKQVLQELKQVRSPSQ
jgi:flagellar hook-basal body complex protein FliE